MGKLVAGHDSLGNNRLKLSGHLCGRWVREICKGDWSWFYKNTVGHCIGGAFQRFQLNFHSYLHQIDEEHFVSALQRIQPMHYGFGGLDHQNRQFIFQLDDVNNSILDAAKKGGVDAVPLFDLSGGAGVLPKKWPKVRDGYCGYAGGLSPDNVTEQLEMIQQVVENRPIWIDVETHVRSKDDCVFDLEKVRLFLEAAQPWVIDA